MKVAFYAPLKPPDHPNPSGDREMARAIWAALRYGGHEVTLASDFRSREGQGDAAQQERIIAAAAEARETALARADIQDADIWVTYHNYYKAPDLLGPQAARSLGIPYVQLESTRARKRLNGPWANFAAQAEAASEAAAAIFYFTDHDGVALQNYAPLGQKLEHLRPFLNTTELPALGPRDGSLIAVGMMRPGDKVASYTLIKQALERLPTSLDWHLTVIGDGEARTQVQAMFTPFGKQVTFVGALPKPEVARHMSAARALIWPGVNEAFGMVYLEAQAVGLPIIAQDRPGVRDVVHGALVPVEDGAQGLADKVVHLFSNADAARNAGDAARAAIGNRHLLPAAARRLTDVMVGLL